MTKPFSFFIDLSFILVFDDFKSSLICKINVYILCINHGSAFKNILDSFVLHIILSVM